MAWLDYLVPGLGTGLGLMGALSESRAQSEEAKRQRAFSGQQSALADQMRSLSSNQISAGMPALSKAMSHYMTLMSPGSRGALASELAPERAGIAETASGAQRGLEAKMAPGGTRDRAIAELARVKQGQLGLLPMTARANAFQQGANLGGSMVNRGMTAARDSSDFTDRASGLEEKAFGHEEQGRNAWSQFGSDMFNLWGPFIQGKFGSKGNKNPSGGYGSMPTGWGVMDNG